MTARLYKIRPGAGEFVPGGDIKLLAGHTGTVNVVQFSPDAGVAITGSEDKTVRVWGKESNWDCIKTITEFPAGVKSVIFSPVDPVLATMSANRVTLWAINGSKYQPENRVDMKGSGKQLKVCMILSSFPLLSKVIRTKLKKPTQITTRSIHAVKSQTANKLTKRKQQVLNCLRTPMHTHHSENPLNVFHSARGT